MGIGSCLVGGQLHQRAAAAAGLLDGPAEHGRTQPAAAVGLIHPDRLDLRPQRTSARQPGDERELHRARQLPPGLRHHQYVRRIRVDRAERLLIRGQILGGVHPVPGRPELIGGKQAHDGRNIGGLRPPQNHRRGAELNGRQIIHRPSLPGGARRSGNLIAGIAATGQDGLVLESTGPPSEPARDYVGSFAVERDRLNELLADLQTVDWTRPSPCPGWTVLGLCCHLVGDDLGLLARDRDSHYGTPAPAGSEADFAAWLDDLQAEWVRAARRLSPRLVTDLLRWAGPQITELFAGQDVRARTASVSWAGPDLVPAWLGQARELSEYWIHRQQILQALGRPSDLRADLAGPVLDGLRWAYPYRLAQAPAPPGDTVSISVTGPLSQTWHLVATDTGWEFAGQPGPRVTATLAMSTEQAWRLLTNNLPAAAQADLAVSGDDAITAILLRTRAIIATPKWA